MGTFRHNTLFAFYYNVSFLKIPIMLGTLPCHKATIQIEEIECWAGRNLLQCHCCDKECPQDGFLTASSLSLLPGLPDPFMPQPSPCSVQFLVFLTGFSCEARSTTTTAEKNNMVREFGLKRMYYKNNYLRNNN